MVSGIVTTLAYGVLYGLGLRKTEYRHGNAPNAQASNISYRNNVLGISFSYPETWIVDELRVDEGYVFVQSAAALDLNAAQSTGKVDIIALANNPDQLDPSAWFLKNFESQVDQPEFQQQRTVGRYSSYAVIANELQQRQHTYLFSDTRVVEVVFPVDQPQFQQTYNAILMSVIID